LPSRDDVSRFIDVTILERSETGQSPAIAIERLRAEAARPLLEATQHPMGVVAKKSGLGDRYRTRNALVRVFGQPPQAIQRLAQNSELV